MFVDNENQFTSGGTSGQSVVSGTNFVASTTTALANVIDSGPLGGQNTPNTNVGRDFGMGYPSWIYWLNVASATSGGSATLTATLVSSAAASLSSTNTAPATRRSPRSPPSDTRCRAPASAARPAGCGISAST